MEKIKVKNYMEEIVFSMLDDILKNINICKCDVCVMDIVSKALNDLPPQYIVTEKGEVYSKINALRQQFEVDIISAVTKAAVIVNMKPRHN